MRFSLFKRRWVLVCGTGIVLAAGGFAVSWFRQPPPAPPLPEDIRDHEVLQAIKDARRVVLDEPDSAEAWGQLGMVFLGNLFDREAVRCFSEARRLDPRDPMWVYGLAQIALKRDADQAIPLLRQAKQVADLSPEYQSAVRCQLAEALLEQNEFDEAEALFREELEQYPKSPRASLGMAWIARRQQQMQRAMEYFEVARASPYARKTANVQLAALCQILGDATAAREYEQAANSLAADPPWPDPLLDKAVALQTGYRGRLRKIAILEKNHQFAEAADLYLRQIEDRPTSEAYVGAGINFARLRDYERAMPLLREGLRLDPESANANYTLALTLFTRAEHESNGNPNSSQATEWFRETIALARRATELKPDHGRAYMFWGLSLSHLGDPMGAIEPLRKGIACLPGELDLQLGLGMALQQTKQYAEAAIYLENAQRLDPDHPRVKSSLVELAKRKMEESKAH